MLTRDELELLPSDELFGREKLRKLIIEEVEWKMADDYDWNPDENWLRELFNDQNLAECREQRIEEILAERAETSVAETAETEVLTPQVAFMARLDR